MSSMVIIVPCRGVRSLHPHHFNAPWPFVKINATGIRKRGPWKYEKITWPGQNREFPELSPKFQKLNPPELRDYTGCQPMGYKDPQTGEFVVVEDMKPELVVPNLDGFELKPYVSYQTDVEIERRTKEYEAAVAKHGSREKADVRVKEDNRWPPPALTSRALFDLFYESKVREYFAHGKYDQPTGEKANSSPASPSPRRPTEN